MVDKFKREIVEKMTELRRQNYHDNEIIERRNREIKEYEDACTALGMDFKTDWHPNDDNDFSGWSHSDE